MHPRIVTNHALDIIQHCFLIMEVLSRHCNLKKALISNTFIHEDKMCCNYAFLFNDILQYFLIIMVHKMLNSEWIVLKYLNIHTSQHKCVHGITAGNLKPICYFSKNKIKIKREFCFRINPRSSYLQNSM